MDVQLTWNEVTGVPDIAGYRVYWGFTEDTETQVASVTEGTAILFGLPDKRKVYFAVTAFDNAGNESAKSEPVMIINRKVSVR